MKRFRWESARWGGPPGPQPAPWPACREWQAPDWSGEQRVQGDPRGPGPGRAGACAGTAQAKACATRSEALE